jgi:hypothetical protein
MAEHVLPEILLISSYPPRECGIAYLLTGFGERIR